MNGIEGNKEKISNLGVCIRLFLCRATKRDIFIIPPGKGKGSHRVSQERREKH